MGEDACGKTAKASDIILVLERQMYACALSGDLLDTATAQLDHITPVSKGGTHEAKNIQVVTRDINRMKGNLDNEEFIVLCKKIAAWNS